VAVNRRLLAWHLVLAGAGGWLLYSVAAPLRAGDLWYVNGFVWAVLGVTALTAGAVGGLLERWLVRRGRTVLSAVVAAAVAVPVLAVALVFAGRFPNAVRYAVSPDILLVPLTFWLLFVALLSLVALRPAADAPRAATRPPAPSAPG
jgi:hypothetical protein